MKLYELSESYTNVLALVDEETPDADILNALATISDAIEVKAGNIANIIKQLEADADYIKSEEKRLKQLRESRTNSAASIKQYLAVTMSQLKLEKIKTPTRTIAFQNSPPALYISNPDVIPQKYLTLVPARYEVRNADVKEDLKAGIEIPGAELQIGRSLRIK